MQRADGQADLPLRHRRRGRAEAGARRRDALLRERVRLPLRDRSPHRQAALAGAPHAGARHGDRGHAGAAVDPRRPRLHGVLGRPRHRVRRDATAPRSGRRSISRPRPSSPPARAPRYLDVDTTPVVDDHPQGRVVYVASYAGGVFALDAATGARVWSNDKAIGVTDSCSGSEPAHAPNPNGPDRDGPLVPAQKMLIASSATTASWASTRTRAACSGGTRCPRAASRRRCPWPARILVGTTPLRAVPDVAAQRQGHRRHRPRQRLRADARARTAAAPT